MLAGLGRWLRIAGYDAAIAENGVDDREILNLAMRENRLLLTCDRHFLEMRAPDKAILFIENSSIVEGVRQLNLQLKLNWLYSPFSRCLICNTLLEKPSLQDIPKKVPEGVLANSSEYWYCPQCKKIYWKGSHTERMLEQLQHWQTT